MESCKAAFQIHPADNVAVALEELSKGEVCLRGASEETVEVLERIPEGHKLAVADIQKDGLILKYGVPVGRATRDIRKGSWVSLHCMESLYDRRSSHLDAATGKPEDLVYEVFAP